MVQTRAATKSRNVSRNDGEPTQDTPLGPDDSLPPAKKGQRRSVALPKKRRCQKERNQLCRLNVDVLLIIAENTHPMDLFNLARTCKYLRNIFMSKYSAFAWRSARRHLQNLPDCPVDLSEHEYINLAFYAPCHDCEGYTKTVFLKLRQQYREDSIFARLNEHGYGPEIRHFGSYAIQRFHSFIFSPSKLLTEKEWCDMWPRLQKNMDGYRSQRLQKYIFQLLAPEFADYVAHPPPNVPEFDRIPNTIDVALFPPFRCIIEALENQPPHIKLFESAFAELPVFIDKWRKDFDTQLAELVKIPSASEFSSRNASGDRVVAPDNEPRGAELSNSVIDRLRLACAVFKASSSAVMYPEVLNIMYPQIEQTGYYESTNTNTAYPGLGLPIDRRFKIKFLKDAPYIVHACGLDPNVATAEDMDRRNARLSCLCCRQRNLVWGWRDAMQHATFWHNPIWRPEHDMMFRWQVIGEEHTDAIQDAESSVTGVDKSEPHPFYMRCLLCRPHVGDAGNDSKIIHHLFNVHNISLEHIKEGVHYMKVERFYKDFAVEMTERRGNLTFKKASDMFHY